MKRIDVASSSDVRENELFVTEAGPIAVILTRVAGRVYVVENRCAHLGWSMARGTVSRWVIRCPWHGSRYDVRSGGQSKTAA